MDSGDVMLAGKFAELRPHLGERAWRLYLGSEARARALAGRGGLAAAAAVVAAAAGVSRATVLAGAGELAEGAEPLAGRARRPGAGRRKAEDAQPGLAQALAGVLEATVRGDPVSALTWTTLSLRDLEREMAVLGFACRKDALARMLHEAGFSLQGMSRVLEGRQHPDRDAQFRWISARVAEFAAAGEPAVSADGKKKEQLGPFCRAGRSWRPAGDPVRVRDHDFPDAGAGKVAPYGVYDIAANRGFVVVGTSSETAAFAVGALRRWWLAEGAARYPRATRLLVTCDAGGSNACANRLWKDGLAGLAEEAGLEITVCHFPPGTSKWNKIEHRLFCHVTRAWKARPLMTKEDAVAGIAATVTFQGLKCTAVLDEACYPLGAEISEQRVKYLEGRILARDGFHGDWNYTLLPAPRPAPEPGPEPGPGPARTARVPRAVLNHPALTGVPAQDMTALAAALQPQFEARLQLRYRTRHGHRARAVRNGAPHGNRKLDVTDHLLALRLRSHLNLPLRVVGSLLGIDPATASLAAALARELLSTARITLPDTPPAGKLPRTPGELLSYATAAGIPLAIPENGQPMPDHFRTHKYPATRNTPGTAN
jgi:Rhodopirellula transposase DDE domain